MLAILRLFVVTRLIALALDVAPAFGADAMLGGHLRWGSCRLDKDDTTTSTDDIPWPLLCLRPDANAQMLLKQATRSSNVAYTNARIYGGLHFWSFASIHAEGVAERNFDLTYADVDYKASRYTKMAILQLGNVGLHKLQVTAGKMSLPFGVNFRPLQEIYEEWIKNDDYWDGPDYVTTVSWDNQRDFIVTAGWAASDIPRRDEPTARAAVVRASYDISAMDGTRLVVSGYGAQAGERRVGAALVSIGPDGAGGVFEWVRSRPDVTRNGVYEPQMFRLSYRGAFYSKTRWLFEYEDSGREYRVVTLGHDFALPDYAMFRTSASYHDAATNGGDSFWFIAVGLNVQT